MDLRHSYNIITLLSVFKKLKLLFNKALKDMLSLRIYLYAISVS